MCELLNFMFRIAIEKVWVKYKRQVKFRITLSLDGCWSIRACGYFDTAGY